MQTAPTPVLTSLHQIGSQSIASHVPANRMEMAIVLNRPRVESPLIEMTRPRRLAMSMPAPRVRQRQPVKKIRDSLYLPEVTRRGASESPSRNTTEAECRCEPPLPQAPSRTQCSLRPSSRSVSSVRTVQHMINPTLEVDRFGRPMPKTMPKRLATITKRFLPPYCNA
jgi:hypothetical protein